VSAGLVFEEQGIPGVILVKPQVHGDERGFFIETYHEAKYREGGIDAVFVQDNHSKSGHGTLRGLHAQAPHWQGKLVRVVQGEVFDVAVDVRKGSESYGQHVCAVLSEDNKHQLWVPPGFLHGFLVTSETAEFEYKCTEVYYPEEDFTVAWDDPDLAIPWPNRQPRLSEKDAHAPRLADLKDRLPRE
jgi:dTDP-4-dehydrorhamnose 3,5-epimerase